MSSATILIIDDEEGIRDTLEGILDDEGYSVATAATAEDGLEYLRKEGPDLVILDIWLPNMDGIEFLGALRSKSIKTPVVMLSSDTEDAQKKKCKELGAIAFLSKPPTIDKISLVFKKILAL